MEQEAITFTGLLSFGVCLDTAFMPLTCPGTVILAVLDSKPSLLTPPQF